VNVGIVTELHFTRQERATRAYLYRMPVSVLIDRQEANRDRERLAREQADARRLLATMVDEQAQFDMYKRLAKTNAKARKLLAIIEKE
jgi:hypothetical protein